MPFSWCCPLQSLFCPVSVLSTHPTPPLSSVPWLIRPGCQAVSTEYPFVDYSPRNHVAQLNYSWLQRLHLLLRHLEDALLNQPIAATASMIPAHKESLLGYPCCPWGPTANAGFLSVPGDVLWEYNTCMRELCREPRDSVRATSIFTVIHILQIQWWISGVFYTCSLSICFLCLLLLSLWVQCKVSGDLPLSMAGQMFRLKEFNIKISLSAFLMCLGGGTLLREFVGPYSYLCYSVDSVKTEQAGAWRHSVLWVVILSEMKSFFPFNLDNLSTVVKHKASQFCSMCVNHLRPSF